MRSNGAEVLTTTSECEVARFKANGGVNIVYRNKHGSHLSFFGSDAEIAWESFQSAKSWRNQNAERQRRRQEDGKSVLVRTLLKRDGPGCFFCPDPLEPKDRSIEHLLSLTQGGSWHVENLVLAHRVCNEKASHLSVMEKVRIREGWVPCERSPSA